MSSAERTRAYRARIKLRMEQDPEFAVEYMRKQKEQDAQYYERHKEVILAKGRLRDRRESARRQYLANKERYYAHAKKRKALLRGATQAETVYRSVVWERDSGTCGICNKLADPRKWHLDHIVPLSKGGQHTYSNVQVAHPSCNLSKHNKTPSEV